MTSVSGGGETYTYDANGNMITRVEGGLTYTQTFDAENRLISVTVSGQTTQFIYDGDGNLVKKVKPDNSKTIYVDGIYEVDKTSGGSVTPSVLRTSPPNTKEKVEMTSPIFYIGFGGEPIESLDGKALEGVGQTTQFIYDGDGNLVKKIKPDNSKTIYVGGIYEVDKTSGGSVTPSVPAFGGTSPLAKHPVRTNPTMKIWDPHSDFRLSYLGVHRMLRKEPIESLDGKSLERVRQTAQFIGACPPERASGRREGVEGMAMVL
ncbi:MAG: RHS repeat domain-containing protein [Anaerolineales bacterium]